MTIPLTENQILGMMITEPRGKGGMTEENFQKMVDEDAMKRFIEGASTWYRDTPLGVPSATTASAANSFTMENIMEAKRKIGGDDNG